MKTNSLLALAIAFGVVGYSNLAASISLETAPPVVVKTVPAAGATDVDPALTELRVTYNKPMQDHSWSWSTWGEENFPEMEGQPRYLADGRTCVLTVKLQPDKFYATWLNSEKFKNFKDREGRPAVPYLLTFTTRGESTNVGPGVNQVSEYEYVVQVGNTLSAIAHAYQAQGGTVTVGEILEANPGLNPSRLQVGQSIIIPVKVPPEEDGVDLAAGPQLGIGRAGDLPGKLMFHGRYQHHSRNRAIETPSELWLAESPDRSLTALAQFSEKGTSEVASGDSKHRLTSYRIKGAPSGDRPGYRIDLELRDGKALLTRRGIREDVDGRGLDVPQGARFDPNTRPDLYCAANILLRTFALKPGETREFRMYDWDNSGEALADYTIQVTHAGKERVEVPAGTFEANHLILKQLTSADTWFKKRAGHVTDFWVLDNHVIVRVLRHREPYEIKLLDYTVPQTLDTFVGVSTTQVQAWVENYFSHNYRDITSRDTLEWGGVAADPKGNLSIQYKYRAKIWDKETVTNNQVFTFDPAGRFISVEDAPEKQDAGAARRFVRVVLDGRRMTVEGQPATPEGLETLLAAVPDRGQTVLEWAVPSMEITIQQQSEWTHRFARLAQNHGFEYSSYVGVHPFGSKGGMPPVKRATSGAAVSEDDLKLLLNDDQKAVITWTDRQFRSYFDNRAFDGWSEDELKALETKSIDALDGPRSREYYTAINTLGAMRSVNALPHLRAIAFERVDGNNRNRWMCVRVLGIMGDRQSIPDLIHLVYHGNQNTHWWAQISLVQLTGQNFGGDWEAWGKWWSESGGQPPHNPEIIHWWEGQADTVEGLKQTLETNDEKFINDIRPN